MKNQHSLCVHSGGRVVESLEEILTLDLPAETDSYHPVGFGQLIETIDLLSAKDLPMWTLQRRQYALAPGHGKVPDQRFFFIHSYTSTDSDSDMSLAIAGRSSHDKSISVGLVGGASVFVCDNLCLSGSVKVMRKHTRGFSNDFRHLVRDFLESIEEKYTETLSDRDLWKALDLTNDQAYQTLGMIQGRNNLSSRQTVAAYEQWRTPNHADFLPRNLWSLYNATTEAAKSSPFNTAAECLTGLTRFFKESGKSIASARGIDTDQKVSKIKLAPATEGTTARFEGIDV